MADNITSTIKDISSDVNSMDGRATEIICKVFFPLKILFISCRATAASGQGFVGGLPAAAASQASGDGSVYIEANGTTIKANSSISSKR